MIRITRQTWKPGTPLDPFLIEVKSLTGRWCSQVSCESDDPAIVRKTMRAQGCEWMLDKREWRVVPYAR